METGISSGLMGYLGSYTDFTFTPNMHRIHWIKRFCRGKMIGILTRNHSITRMEVDYILSHVILWQDWKAFNCQPGEISAFKFLVFFWFPPLSLTQTLGHIATEELLFLRPRLQYEKFTEKFKNTMITARFGFVFEENSGRKITWLTLHHSAWVVL